MIEALLIEQFPSAESLLISENTTYDFKIKNLKPAGKNFQILYTDGMHKYTQPVNEKCAEFERIELYFCLPSYWNLKDNNWPLLWLNKLAELPQKKSTWYGPGDTIPAGSPPEKLSPDFAANHFMLVQPIELEHELTTNFNSELGVKFFGIIPLFQQELDYKIRNSATVLTSRLTKKTQTEKLDTFRTPVCRKRVLGF